MIAILEDKNILTKEEAKELSDKLGVAMLPSDYRETQRLIKKILSKI
jgi:hypothetical protein